MPFRYAKKSGRTERVGHLHLLEVFGAVFAVIVGYTVELAMLLHDGPVQYPHDLGKVLIEGVPA